MFGRYGVFCVLAFIGLVTLTFWPWNWCTSRMCVGDPSY